MDNFFDYVEILEDKQVRMVAYKLKGGASALWDRIQATGRKHGELTTNFWTWMRRLVFDHFLPSDYQQTLFKQYNHCQQGSRTIAENIDEFQELRAKYDLNESESQE